MWRFGLMVIGFGILVGCNQGSPSSPNETHTRASNPPVTLAWGERIDLGTNAKKVQIVYPGNPNGTQNIDLQGQTLFDTPTPPIDTESLGTEVSIDLETYNTPINSTLYTQRGTLKVLNNLGQEIASYKPYGSVVNRQITYLASVFSQNCNAFTNQLTQGLNASLISGFIQIPEDTFAITIPNTFSLCAGSIDVGAQGTSQALARLQTILSGFSGYVPILAGKGFVTDKNTISSLFGGIGSPYAYDPTCPEIARKLDPFGNLGFDQISTSKLKTDLNITAASKTGLGVNINIIGGGIPDTFTCIPNYSFAKHDTHVKSLIQTIAPNATITPYSACNSSGVCKGSDLAKALMQIVASNPTQPNIINLSLGSPLPNNIMFALLELLRVRHNMPVFASGGNARRAPAQYPASYSSGVAALGQPSLANVISVASVGWFTGAYRIAAFNTRANADVFTQGVNLCPDSVLGNRCLLNQPLGSVSALGITGSSFSAPVAAGLMALIIEQNNKKVPADLHACVQKNRKEDTQSKIYYAALVSPTCP